MQLSSLGRWAIRGVLVVGLGVLGTSATFAQEKPAAAAAEALTLNSGAGVIFLQLKSDRTADFDWLVEKIKEAMKKSEDATVKQQVAGMKVYKSADAPQGGNLTYIMVIDPAVKDADYSLQTLLKLVYAAFPEEQQEIFKKLQGAFGGPTSRLNVQLLSDFSK